MSDSNTPPPTPQDDELVRERTRDQVRIIIDALREEGKETVGWATTKGDDPADFVYLYRKEEHPRPRSDVGRVIAPWAVWARRGGLGQPGQRAYPAGGVQR